MKLDLDNYSAKTKEQKIKGKFINRELSWLEFNNRVLYYANNKDVPLNERLRFLGIACNNLDEFIAVRFASALQDKREPVKKIRNGIKKSMDFQYETYLVLRDELKKNGVELCKVKDLGKKEKEKIGVIFRKEIFPLLTPINIGTVNEIPNFYSGQSCIVVTVKQGNLENLVVIPIDNNLNRVITVGNKVLMIEDVILQFLGDLFINKEIISSGCFRVIKDGSISLDHDSSKFLLDRMLSTLEKRSMANPLFLIISSSTPKRLEKILASVFDIDSENIYSNSKIIDYRRFMDIELLSKKHSYKEFEPNQYEVVEETHSIFNILKKEDILLHHPYDSYETVVKFIEHAAIDPKVMTIKQTLYRVSSEHSPIVDALCMAAKRGKSVTVLIEIKARFDEQRNISLIEKLQKSGVNVILGMEYLKTHGKMCVVIRKEKEKFVIYSHIGTGNYNEKTSRQYTDISYFTSRQKVGSDLLHIFNILSGVSTPDEKLQKVFYAPVSLRKKLLKNIDREIEYAKKGKRAEIFLKLNSINDEEMINKLYEAAHKGVQVYIIARGICSLVSTKNLYIKSIVGRFLEHSRIYYFRNGGDDEYYISSADLLTRNLDRRVEILIEVNDKTATKRLKRIIAALKADSKNSFVMDKEGDYKKAKGEFDCHQYFIDGAEKKLKMKIVKKKQK